MKSGARAGKKGAVIGLTVLVAAFAAAGFLWLRSDQAANRAKIEVTLDEQFFTACRVFDEEKAKTLLGEAAALVGDTNQANSASDDIAVSRCTYVLQTAAAGDRVVSAGLTVRLPRTESGRAANEAAFASGSLPPGAEEVTGYGETAYWNPEYGQLHVLRDGAWYILEYGSAVPTERSLSETEKFAAIIKDSW